MATLTARCLVPVLVFLVFLSFRPTLSVVPLPGGILATIKPTAKSILKGIKSGIKLYDKYKKVEDLFQNLGVVTSPPNDKSEKAMSLDDVGEGMFAFQFGVGVPPHETTATGLLSISSLLTWINRYNASENVSCCGFKEDNSICCAECGAACQRYQGYYLVSDRFTFPNVGYLDSYFEGSLIGANDSTSPVGIISFSRSPYSVVSNLRTMQFSYFFSYNSNRESSISLGDNVSNMSRRGLQAAQLINSNLFYYFVNLTQISVGNKAVAINPQKDFTYGVILDTIIPIPLLAEPAYNKFRSEIVAQLGQPVASDGFDMCYDNSTHWPNLTLSFSGHSGYAQMVLRKENYVVADDDARIGCVAIVPTSSQGISVIGSMAQLDRQMIFDVEQNMLYFDQYPDIGFSCDTKLTIALNLVVVYFIILLLCW